MPDDDPAKTKRFVEGIDFYFDDGLMVLTRRYLLERGYCCTNGCRHCPYQTDLEEEDLELIGPAR
jgi:hypothetical protein